MQQQQLGRIDVHGVSLRGETHERNHDHFAIATLNKSMRVHQTNLTFDDEARVHGINQGHVFIVADGISGGPAPARASGQAVDSVVQYFLNEMPWYHFADGSPDQVTLALEDALRNAQDDLQRNAPEALSEMGSTMTLAFVSWPNLYVAHVGDSRCYLQRENAVEQLTTDHTLAQFRRKVGGRPTRRGRHILWNAIGGNDADVCPEVRHVRLESGDVLALVTDGVTKVRSEGELRAALAQGDDAEAICDRLLQGTGRDDRTAVVIRFVPQSHVESETADPDSPPPLTERKPTPGAPTAVPPSTPKRRGPRRAPKPARLPPADPDADPRRVRRARSFRSGQCSNAGRRRPAGQAM